MGRLSTVSDIEKDVRRKIGDEMNTLHIAAIECHDGGRYEIDPATPFVLVIPSGGFDVYDENANLIDITQNGWYELTEPQ